MQQPLTLSEDQRLSSEPLAPEDAATTDQWRSADSLTPLERRSRLGGAVGWNFNMPLGSMRDFVENISPVGFEIQLRYWAMRRISFGLSGERDSYADERPRSSYQVQNGALTATAYNHLFSAILRFIPTYYLLDDGPVLPFVAPNIGVAWNEYRSRAADLELSDSKVSIVYGAEDSSIISSQQWPIIGWRIASSRLRASGSANTMLRIAARSSAPCGSMTASPNAFRIAGMAAPPAEVSACATASVSTMCAPCAANRSATVLLPLPIPPVNPTRKRRESMETV